MERARRFEERVSQEDFPRQGERDCGLHSKSLRPSSRRVEEARRLSSQASTEAASRSLMAGAPRRGPAATAFLRCRGEKRGTGSCLTRMPVRLVSLPLVPHICHQLAAFWSSISRNFRGV